MDNKSASEFGRKITGHTPKLLTIKLSLPGVETLDLAQFLGPMRSLESLPFTLHVNKHVDNPDYWFVVEGFEQDDSEARIDKSRIIFLGAEAGHPPDFWLRDEAQRGFLSQFGGTRGHLARYEDGAEASSPFLPWMLFANHGASIFSPKTKSQIDYIWSDVPPTKSSRKISMFCSNQQWNPYHKRRFDFAKKLKEVFPDHIDWFGNGVNNVATKFEGLHPYRHSLVLENGNGANLITEKLIDAYLGWCFPIYSGASNVHDYFPQESLLRLDLEDFNKSCKQIEAILGDESHWESHLDSLVESRKLARRHFNFLDRLGDLANALEQRSLPQSSQLVRLKPLQSFEPRKKVSYRLALAAYNRFFRS